MVTFIRWPYEYVSSFQNGYTRYALYTPIVGARLGAAGLFSIAAGVLAIGGFVRNPRNSCSPPSVPPMQR